ncbi:MAG TPA: hypothetical protein VIK27_00360 [Candidatus Aquilonibacter sp.]
MKHKLIRTVAPLPLQPLRWMAYASVASYYRVAYRIRVWGRLPRKRGATLVVANHQHEIESPVIVADQGIASFSWRDPIFTVSSRRMWEPGFFAERIPWLAPLRAVNLGWLFGSIGMQPIENELQSRPFASVAFMLTKAHGNLDAAAVFAPRALERLPEDVRMLGDILLPAHFAFSRSYVRLNELSEPYRAEVLRATRAEIDDDIAHFEALARDGATIFLTPEGFYSGDGKMQRLRGILTHLAPLATIWLTAISYDPYDDRRLTMLYRVLPALPDVALETQLKARRPITVSALLCTWLASQQLSFTRSDAVAAVERQLAMLPGGAFIVPELRRSPEASVDSVLAGMMRHGALARDNERFNLAPVRKHPQFPRTDDIIAYQRNFHEETLEGLRALQSSGNDARG